MFTVTPFLSGYIMADGGAMFGAIPKQYWQQKYPCDENNLCRLAMRCLLVESVDRKILVDLGMGNKYTQQMSSYRPSELIDISEFLLSRGIDKCEITDVILTHLHFDHCGYATSINVDGAIIPTFANASYWLSRKQWVNMKNISPLEKDSIINDDIYPIFEAGQLRFVEESMELYPGLNIEIYDGHTQGQLVPIIYTDKGIVAFPGDLIPTSAHVPLEWLSAYDLCAQTSYEEKLIFLNRAVDKNYNLVYCHDAYVELSEVEKINDDFASSNEVTAK